MTTDTAAIRAQMEALAGFTPEPWNADHVRQNARPIAAAPDMLETILALCDALEDERAKCDEWVDRAMTELGNMLDMRCENDHLRNFIADFSETKFDRIDRRSPDPQDDLDPLTDYLAIEAWQEDARAALAQKGGK